MRTTNPETLNLVMDYATDAEVCAYVRRHGGDRRRRILGI
jgi:hypothetical protein